MSMRELVFKFPVAVLNKESRPQFSSHIEIQVTDRELPFTIESEIIRIMREYFPVKKKEPKTQAIDPASILSAGELGVIEHNGRVMVDSVSLAKVFGKNHKDVLRAIRNLDCSQEFTKRNFTPSSYTDSTGRKLAAYYMTRDGFTFLVMGFTGTIAAKFKEAYINAFNAMEEALKQRKDSGLPKLSLSQADIDKFDNSTPFTADMTAEELADHDGK